MTLTVAFALTAVASATASAALPEFVPGTGEKLPIKLEGSVSGATEVTLRNETNNGIYCDGTSFKGEITGAKAASLTAELKNCKAEDKSNYQCSTSGAGTGDVVVSGSGTLNYIDKATKRVGLVLKVAKEEILCGGAYEYVIRGSIVIPLNPIDTKTSTLDMAIKGLTKQEFTSYENESGEIKTAKLEVEVGAGFQPLVWNVGVVGEIALSASKPFTISA
ncbi:MAG TPA: hypothetical protein VGY13_06655 [Solirubrobacteraceae bacterium]|nr:hypothetical protein [Solirubrobacteraceae bacterium]